MTGSWLSTHFGAAMPRSGLVSSRVGTLGERKIGYFGLILVVFDLFFVYLANFVVVWTSFTPGARSWGGAGVAQPPGLSRCALRLHGLVSCNANLTIPGASPGDFLQQRLFLRVWAHLVREKLGILG